MAVTCLASRYTHCRLTPCSWANRLTSPYRPPFTKYALPIPRRRATMPMGELLRPRSFRQTRVIAAVHPFFVNQPHPSLCGSQSCRALCFIPFLLRICLTEELAAQPLHRRAQHVSHPILRLLFRRCFQRLAYFLLTQGPHHRPQR